VAAILRFFVTIAARTVLYTLSLHDALPISRRTRAPSKHTQPCARACRSHRSREASAKAADSRASRARSATNRPRAKSAGNEEARSEEHTSELQSRENLVCRLLLEKKNRRGK